MEMDWMDMVYYQKQVQKLTRLLLPAKQTNLTVSECELLAWLYQEPEQNTPVLLSQRSGMKKEAVSRFWKKTASAKKNSLMTKEATKSI